MSIQTILFCSKYHTFACPVQKKDKFDKYNFWPENNIMDGVKKFKKFKWGLNSQFKNNSMFRRKNLSKFNIKLKINQEI